MSKRTVKTLADLNGLEREGLSYVLRSGFITQQHFDFTTKLYDFVEAEAAKAGITPERVNVLLREARNVGNAYGGALAEQNNEGGLAVESFQANVEDVLEDGAIGVRLLDQSKALDQGGRVQ